MSASDRRPALLAAMAQLRRVPAKRLDRLALLVSPETVQLLPRADVVRLFAADDLGTVAADVRSAVVPPGHVLAVFVSDASGVTVTSLPTAAAPKRATP